MIRSLPRHRRPVRGRQRLVVAVAAVALAVAGCGGDDTADGGNDTADGGDDRLPALVLTGLDGGQVALDEPTEAPRVFNLWATWCAPCRAELPAFDEVAVIAEPTVSIIGVNVGDDRDSVESFVDELELDFPQLLDPGAELNAALGVTNMPTTLFVDADGSIAFVHLGAVDTDELTSLIDEHLGVAVDA